MFLCAVMSAWRPTFPECGSPVGGLRAKRRLSCLACSRRAHLSRHLLCDIYARAFAHVCPRLGMRVRVIIFLGGLQPAGLMRPSYISQCRQPRWRCITHELLKAICGRWRSPLLPQPRRHQQMVGVKTLNIKQPPFIPPPRFPLAHELFLSVFWCFRLYLEANHEQLMAAERSEGFSECWGFLDICYFP